VTTRLIAWTTVFGGFAVLAYAGRAAGGKPPKDALYQWGSVANGLIQYAIFFGVVVLILIGVPKREYLALRRPTSWWTAVQIAGGLVALLWILGVALSPFLHPGREQGLTPSGWDPHRAAPFAANFAVVALVAPVVEELAYRGLGYTLLSRRFGRWAAVVLAGTFFALAHGLVQGLPLLIVFGCGLAYMRSRVESVYPGILFHAAFNGFVLLAAVKFFQT
jgi:membrane protease YdiL (CAAX protease family)